MGNDRAGAARAGRRRSPAPQRALILGAALALASCGVIAAPTRVASLNLCTDTLLFELLPTASIVSVTRLSRDPDLSPFHALAATMTVNRGEVEEVLAVTPDLVVTTSGGSGLAERMFEHYGITVLHLPHANDFASYRHNLRQLAGVLDVEARAERLIQRSITHSP